MYYLGLTVLGMFLVTVGHIRCLRSTLELCLFLILPTSKPEHIIVSHTFLLNSVICNTLLSAYSVVKKSQEKTKAKAVI